MKKIFLSALLLLAISTVWAQANPPALNSIKIEDLKKDLYEFAPLQKSDVPPALSPYPK